VEKLKTAYMNIMMNDEADFSSLYKEVQSDSYIKLLLVAEYLADHLI